MELASTIAAIISAIASVCAVFIAYLIFRRQRNISLFERRMQIIKDYDIFIYDILPDEEWDGSYRPIDTYKTAELISLLGPKFAGFQMIVMNSADFVGECNKSIQIVKLEGKYNDKTLEEWETLRKERLTNLRTIFSETLDEHENVFRL